MCPSTVVIVRGCRCWLDKDAGWRGVTMLLVGGSAAGFDGCVCNGVGVCRRMLVEVSSAGAVASVTCVGSSW